MSALSLPTPAAATAFVTRLVASPAERAAYHRLRHAIFCDEQGVFSGSDRDEWDAVAHPIVCLSMPEARVVGVVRIWEEAPGQWWGGRLGVHADFRTVGNIGRHLVQTAVSTANAWGATRFRATVQKPNVVFFRRLHWQTLAEMELHGQPHHLMEADLGHYPPPAATPIRVTVAIGGRGGALDPGAGDEAA